MIFTVHFLCTFRKDYTTGKLTSGLLQLAPHTHLVLDETSLQPGKLENHGIESVVHISNLIRTQKLKVNFKFYNIEYDANVPVLLLSEGKSMFPVSILRKKKTKRLSKPHAKHSSFKRYSH